MVQTEKSSRLRYSGSRSSVVKNGEAKIIVAIMINGCDYGKDDNGDDGGCDYVIDYGDIVVVDYGDDDNSDDHDGDDDNHDGDWDYGDDDNGEDHAGNCHLVMMMMKIMMVIVIDWGITP
ncbi:Hypothetical predicted protein [Paramuricea clavata]|uniref:Uncharacterized protein n=1 Tax=Paramuricea clavata TaxID=317549 RepID=A0A6S7GLR4_PARCT|nr:Hypothetical predicted protein [Paramuricea clavata]